MKKIILIALATMAATQLHAADNKQKADTLTVTTTPQMHCSGCENKIKQNIRFVKGVKEIKTSVPDQQVTIIYNKEKAGYADFEKAFRKIGYEIKKK